jgi:hypothetical protein
MGLDIDRQYYALHPEGRELCLTCHLPVCVEEDKDRRVYGLKKGDCPIALMQGNGHPYQRERLSVSLAEAERVLNEWGPLTIRSLGWRGRCCRPRCGYR